MARSQGRMGARLLWAERDSFRRHGDVNQCKFSASLAVLAPCRTWALGWHRRYSFVSFVLKEAFRL